MALQIEKLSAIGVLRLKKPGYHNDGAGLYLQVSPSGSKSWVFRYKLAGRAREMGLGALHTFGLAEARERAREARQLLADGIDPIDNRAETKVARALSAARAVTFRVDAEACVESMRPGWRNARQADIWLNSLNTHAAPLLDRKVGEIETDDVLACLKPIWSTTTETATRVRARIEAVLDYSKALKHRTGENPARWRGNLDKLLARPSKVSKVEHHAAIPYAEAPEFMTRLAGVGGMGARALEFAILTAARSGEVRGARWGEFDLEAKTWTCPADRMKMGREHRVPLSKAAMTLLRSLPAGEPSDLVFPAARGGTLSDMTLSAVTRRMKVDAVPHGFRSTFRDWVAECTTFPSEVAEAALAHAVPDKVEAAYRRGDLFEKRVKLMEAWAQYLSKRQIDSNVLSMRAA